MPMGSITMCSNTFYMYDVDAGSILRWLSDSTMTEWHHFDSTSDPEPQNMSQIRWVWLLEATAIYPWTAYQCAQTLCICIIWMQGAVQVGYQPQPWHNDIILTPWVTQNHKVWAKKGGYNCLRLLPYEHGQHIYVLKHFIYVWCGCRKQFQLAVSLNHDVMTSFWLHKWPRTPKSDTSSVGIPVWGCFCMPQNSISICSSTLHMSNMDAGSSLRWLCALSMM